MKVFAKSAEGNKREREGGCWVVSCWRAGGREGQSWVRSLRGPCSVRGPQSTPGRGSPERRTNNRGKVYTADRRAHPITVAHTAHGTRRCASLGARPSSRAPIGCRVLHASYTTYSRPADHTSQLYDVDQRQSGETKSIQTGAANGSTQNAEEATEGRVVCGGRVEQAGAARARWRASWWHHAQTATP